MVSKAAVILSSILIALIASAAIVVPAYAQVTGGIDAGVQATRGDGVPADLFGADGVFTTIVNVLLFIVGVLSVIMLIIGGLRYVISGGNATAVTAAKNTILYAIIGLIIAFFSYAIINFVLNSLTGGTSGTNV